MINLSNRKEVIFQIILAIVALDYIVVGMLTIFGVITNELITPMFGVTQVGIGIFFAFLLTDVNLHKKMIWGAVLVEIIIAISALVNTITTEIEGEFSVFVLHVVYLILITSFQYFVNYADSEKTENP